MSRPDADLIIAGAGAAGWTLLHSLMQSPWRDRKILMLDQSFEPRNDRTWCFWDSPPLYMEELLHTWRELDIVSRGEHIHGHLGHYRYACLSSGSYISHLKDLYFDAPNVTFLETKIEEIGESPEGDRTVIQTGLGEHTAPWAVQSIFTPPGWDKAPLTNRLLQHFVGWEILTDSPRFDPSRARLMDFDTEQLGGLTFFYLLPYSGNRALVEHTLFSGEVLPRETYEEAIREWLETEWGLLEGSYRIERKEQGVIPMEDRRYRAHDSRVVHTGAVAGLAKPSTGYTFRQIVRHAEQITTALTGGSAPPQWPGNPYRFRVYDMMLLDLLVREPEWGREIFHRLFKRNGMERVLSFLNQETSITQELGIFLTMPHGPFFRAIWRMRRRILDGA
ncbi:MAG: lycopene cyclase family protein [Bacteroidota bacterium]